MASQDFADGFSSSFSNRANLRGMQAARWAMVATLLIAVATASLSLLIAVKTEPFAERPASSRLAVDHTQRAV